MTDLTQDDLFGGLDLGGLLAPSAPVTTTTAATPGPVVFGQADARAYVRGKQLKRVPATTTTAAPAAPPSQAAAVAAKPPAPAKPTPAKATRTASRMTTPAPTPAPTATRRIEEAPALLRSSVLLAFLRACYREAKRRHLQLAELAGVAAPDELDAAAFTADALAFLDSPSLRTAIGLRAIAISGPVITEIAPPPKPTPAASSSPTMAAPIAAPRGGQELAAAAPGGKVAHKPNAWYRQGKPHTPIVPRVVLIGDQKHPYHPPALDFRATTKGTPFMVGIGDGDVAAAGSAGAAKGRTINQHLCYCVPNQAAEDHLIELHGAFATALDDLAAVLRDLGSYTLRLEEAGGHTKQKDPLTPTVIRAEDPDGNHWFWTTWKVPTPERQPITRHTPKMVQLGDTAGLRTMDDVFVCPDDAAWRRVEAALAAVTEARTAVQAYLKVLGTYEEAIADNRYGSDPPTGAEAPDTTPMDATLADAGTDADAAPAPEPELPSSAPDASPAEDAPAAQEGVTEAPQARADEAAEDEQPDEGAADEHDAPLDEPPAEAAFDAVQAQVDSVEAFIAQEPETPPTKRQLLDMLGLLVRCGEDLDELRESGLTNPALERQIEQIRPTLLDRIRAAQ